MGDRISIQFRNGDDFSVILFSHWDGLELKEYVEHYIAWLKSEIIRDKQLERYSLGRFHVGTIMVDLIRDLTKNDNIVKSNYYLCSTKDEGDNSDNGHHIYDLKTFKWID